MLWRQQLSFRIMLLRKEYIEIKYRISYPGSHVDKLKITYLLHIGNLIKHQCRLRKQIIKCKTK